MWYSPTVAVASSLCFVVYSRTVNVQRDDRARAGYTLYNDPAGASIISMQISLSDGTLTSAVKTSTGGLGMLGNTATGQSGPDGLFGQNAVVVSEDYLFTVNAGSNTLAMFSIDTDDPSQLTLVGEPANTLGEFPMSVAYSSSLKTACALNGGAVGGVTCFSTDHKKGLTVLDKAPRSISPALNQTTPPVGPPGTGSNVFFNPASTALFAVVKGSPGTNSPTPSTFFVWPVIDGKVSTTAVVSSPSDLLVDFGGDFISDDSLLVTDASFGVALLTITSSWQVVEEVHTPVAGQIALCWTFYAPRFDSLYAFDAGRTLVTEIDPHSAVIKGQFSFDSNLKGGFDAAVDRTSLYILTSTGSVAVVNLRGSDSGAAPTQIQAFNISAGGSTTMFQGMATYPS